MPKGDSLFHGIECEEKIRIVFKIVFYDEKLCFKSRAVSCLNTRFVVQ